MLHRHVIFFSLNLWGLLGCTYDPPMSYSDARQFFLAHRQEFEQMVSDVRMCPGLIQVYPEESSNRPTACGDGNSALPAKLSSTLRALNLKWANVYWGIYGKPPSDPNPFNSVAFIVESHGIVPHGSGVSISYSVETLNPVAISNGWMPMTESPYHWAYHSSSN